MTNIIRLEEFLLSNDELAKLPNIGNNSEGNIFSFQADFLKGSLDRYKGTYVIYHKGNLVGQSRYSSLLGEAKKYYRISDLALFKVPKNSEELHDAVKNALGEF